jgi:hypothetical protein
MSELVTILISEISATAKTNPHPEVLTGTSGKLDESPDGKHVLVNKAGSVEHEGGPVVNELYKLRFKVAGEFETIQAMTYIGYAEHFQRYVFSKKP